MNTDTFQLRENDLRCMVHINPEAELLAVESGNVSVILSGQAYTVGSGEAMLIFPYQLHGFSHKNAVKAKVYMFSQTVVEFFCKEYSSGLFEKQTFRMDPALFSYLEYALMHLDAPYADLTVKSMFYACSSAFLEQNTPCACMGKTDFSVQRVAEYVLSHLSENLTLQQTARHFGMNKHVLSRAFTDMIGVRFTDFVNNVRIEKSKTLLVGSKDTVIEIAFACGFGSVRSFNRLFSASVGCTPTDYRKRI